MPAEALQVCTADSTSELELSAVTQFSSDQEMPNVVLSKNLLFRGTSRGLTAGIEDGLCSQALAKYRGYNSEQDKWFRNHSACFLAEEWVRTKQTNYVKKERSSEGWSEEASLKR